VAQSTSAWSGWDTQKPATFEKRSLFDSPTTKTPPKKEDPQKEESNEKKAEDEGSEDEGSVEENGDEESANEDPESQFEDDEEYDKSLKTVDTRERLCLLLWS
jgi:hypothetical protein